MKFIDKIQEYRGSFWVPLILLGLLIVYWVYLTKQSNKPYENFIRPILSHVHSVLSILCKKMLIPINFTLSVSDTTTYTRNRNHIYLRIEKSSGCPFDMNTLIKVSIHELSHILTPVTDGTHGPIFHKIEGNLLKLAIKEKYLSDLEIDPEYPMNK